MTRSASRSNGVSTAPLIEGACYRVSARLNSNAFCNIFDSLN